MRGIAGDEYAVGAVGGCQQQILPPRTAREHFIFYRDTDDLFEHAFHLFIGVDCRMQRPVTGRVLHDEKAALVVGDMPMPAVPRTVAQGHHVKQFIAAEQGLTKLRHRALAAQFDAQLGSHHAVAAIAADQIVGTQRLDCTAWRSHACADAAGILYKGHQFATKAHCDAGQRLGDRLE